MEKSLILTLAGVPTSMQNSHIFSLPQKVTPQAQIKKVWKSLLNPLPIREQPTWWLQGKIYEYLAALNITQLIELIAYYIMVPLPYSSRHDVA